LNNGEDKQENKGTKEFYGVKRFNSKKLSASPEKYLSPLM